MAAVAAGADPATPIPSCPGWTLAELLMHTGGVHRWVTAMVCRRSPEMLDHASIAGSGRPDDPHALPAWVAAGAEPLADAFSAADPDEPMWSWGADQHVRFWPRRVAHETGVHRADAELAVGIEPTFDATVAADAIDKLLTDLPHMVDYAPGVAELRGQGEVIVFATPDEGWWRIDLSPDGYAWGSGDGAPPGADALVRAATSELLLIMFGRRTPRAVTGDADLIKHWLTNSSV